MSNSMIEQFVEIGRIIRGIRMKALDSQSAWEAGDGADLYISDYLLQELKQLERKLPLAIDPSPLDEIRSLIGSKERWHYEVIHQIIPKLEELVENIYLSNQSSEKGTELLDLLHPAVLAASFHLFRIGSYRDAVLNSVVAVFDLIRSRTGIDKDGASLVGEVFSIENPRLVLADLETESGKSEQKGFIQILQGIYLGVRNPKAHTLISDLNHKNAAQYLVFASLLARRVEESTTRVQA